MLFRCVTEALVKDAAAAGAPTARRTKPKGQLMVVGTEEKNESEGGCC
jgi:hypothetical protein